MVDATVLFASGPFGGYVTGHERFLVDGHLPGARFADLIEEFSEPGARFAFTRPSAETFSRAAGALGIGEGTSVVVYDAELSQWASRLWWLFRSFGHSAVAVLDGGFTKWRREGRPTESGHAPVEPVPFPAREQPGFWADKREVEAVVASESDAALVCGLPRREFRGELSPRPRAGHIPGSVNVPPSALVDVESRVFLPTERLRAAYEGVLGRRVVAYCAGGIGSAANALALALLGVEDVAIYDGSLSEWVADPASALVSLVPQL